MCCDFCDYIRIDIMPNLYCVPSKKKVRRQENGISYHCTRNDQDDDADMNSSSSSDASSSLVSSSSSPELTAKCNACQKMFKNARCLKIHKTKMHHWGASLTDPVNGPRRRKPKPQQPQPPPQQPKRNRRKSTKNKRKRSNDGSPRNNNKRSAQQLVEANA